MLSCWGAVTAMPTNTPDGALLLHAQAKTGTPEWITCGRCDARWTGQGTCHCAGCHRTFTGVTAFDTHRKNFACVDPATIPTLAQVTRLHWSGWGWAGDDTRWDGEA